MLIHSVIYYYKPFNDMDSKLKILFASLKNQEVLKFFEKLIE